MSRRAMVMVLAAVIAVAVAIPALAASGGGAEAGSVRGLSLRALAKAKLALRTSRGAKRSAHAAAGSAAAQIAASGALKAAASASEKAGGAELKANNATEAVAAMHAKLDFVEGEATFTSEEFKKSPQGPAVTVTVPPQGSGLVQVWAQATIEGRGGVSLYDNGAQVGGQAECAPVPSWGEGELFAQLATPPSPATIATPAGVGSCATSGAPGPVLFQAGTGSNTFELRYAACKCEGASLAPTTFSERRLVVQPLP